MSILSPGSKAGPILWSIDARLARCLQVMHDDLRRPWKLQDLAYESGQSKAWLSANFRRAVGIAPMEYLTDLRVQKSTELLRRTDTKIEAIARAVGYQDAFGFSKAFHRVAGISPRELQPVLH